MADFIKARVHLKAVSRHLLNAIDLADDLRRTLAQAEPVPIWKTLAEIGASAPAGTWDDPVKQQAEPERNFCPRCGKRLHGEGIHTCTPPQTKCEHCSSPLFAAVQCRVCGRKEAK